MPTRSHLTLPLDEALDLFPTEGRTVKEIAAHTGRTEALIRHEAKILAEQGFLETGYSPLANATTWFRTGKRP